MYRPLASQLVAAYTCSDSSVTTPPAWKIIGATLKLLGLMGFWMGDNVNFLGLSGLFDDVSLPREIPVYHWLPLGRSGELVDKVVSEGLS